MLHIVGDITHISKFQKIFESELGMIPDIQTVKARVGWQGGIRDIDVVHYSETLDTWWVNTTAGDKTMGRSRRFWNVFGVGRPLPMPYSNHIKVAINFPRERYSKRIGGAFAKDDTHHIFVLHRGRLGGAKQGIGKKLFWEQYMGPVEKAEYNGSVEQYAVVGQLNSNTLPKQIASFVHDVCRIRATL